MLCKLWMCNWIRLMQLTDDYLLSVASHWRCCSVAVVAAWKSCRIVEAVMARVASGHLSPGPSMVQCPVEIQTKAIWRFVITAEKAPTRAFSWLKAATTAFTFKTLLRHYAKLELIPQSLNVTLGPRRNYHKGRAAIRHYANQTARSVSTRRRP